MKRLLIILFLSLPLITNGQIAAVTSASVAVGGAGGTTPAVTTTGASFIGATVDYHTTAGAGTLTDSKSNTWIQIDKCEVAASASSGTISYYCQQPCVVGSGHTFTTSAHFAQLYVKALSGTATSSPIDQHTCTAGFSSGTTFTIGSITPTVSGSYCIATAENFNGTQPTSISTGFTIEAANPTATAEGAISGVLALSTTATVTAIANGMNNGNPASGAIFNVKPLPVAAAANGAILLNVITH